MDSQVRYSKSIYTEDGALATHGNIQDVKRSFDILIAVLLLVFTCPIFVALFIGNGFSCRRLFYSHERAGRGLAPFKCLKFRSMRLVDAGTACLFTQALSADSDWLKFQKLQNDPRVTPLGRVLRRFSIDELPQLINVLRGEMSIVGPRPVTYTELDRYGAAATKVFSVRPGLTGLWQVSGRNSLPYEKRVELDLKYVAELNIRMDLMIIVKTVPAVLLSRGAY